MKEHPYEKETRSLLKRLQDAGWDLDTVDIDEDEPIQIEGMKTESRNTAAEWILAVDESRLYVSKGDKRKGILIILGNSPGEIVADYHCDPELDQITMDHFDKWAA